MSRYKPLGQDDDISLLPLKPSVITLKLDSKDTFTPQTIDKETHKFIKLIDSHAATIDMVDSHNEDPFMLDTFDEIIQEHFMVDKDFIIARVITEDPKDSKRLYYSYYSAHQLNKVIFRAQPEHSLLHRMKSKNPLNNMTIVGDVHYFSVSKSNQQKTLTSPIEILTTKLKSVLQTLFESHNPSQSPTRSFSSPFRKHTSAPSTPTTKLSPTPSSAPQKSVKSYSSTESHPPLCSETMALSLASQNTYANTHSAQNDCTTMEEWVIQQLSHPLTAAPRSPIKKRAVGTPSPIKIDVAGFDVPAYYIATYYANCDDFLMKSAVRRYFKVNAVNEDDAKLFQLDPVFQNTVIVEEDSLMLSLAGLMASRLMRGLLMVYMAVAILVTLFGVAEQYRFITGFLFAFVLCLGAILFL